MVLFWSICLYGLSQLKCVQNERTCELWKADIHLLVCFWWAASIQCFLEDRGSETCAFTAHIFITCWATWRLHLHHSLSLSLSHMLSLSHALARSLSLSLCFVSISLALINKVGPEMLFFNNDPAWKATHGLQRKWGQTLQEHDTTPCTNFNINVQIWENRAEIWQHVQALF